MANNPFAVLNLPHDPPDPSSTSFTLPIQQNTDIRRQSPASNSVADNIFTAPIIYKRLALPSFLRVRVAVTPPSQKSAEDSAGLIFILPSAPAADSSNAAHAEVAKSGIWLSTGTAGSLGNVTTVACERFPDLSYFRGPTPSSSKITFEISLEGQGENFKLLVFVTQNGEKELIRKCAYSLPRDSIVSGVGKEQRLRECWVGVYATSGDSGGTGEVRFENWELDVKSFEEMQEGLREAGLVE